MSILIFAGAALAGIGSLYGLTYLANKLNINTETPVLTITGDE